MIEVYLPIFWFKVGVYPYVNRLFYGSCLPPVLPSYDVELVIIYWVSCGLGSPCMGDGCLRCSFLLFPSVCLFLLCTFHHSLVEGIGSYILNHFCCPLGSLSFGFIRICFMVVLPLKCTCIPYLPHVCLILSAIPLVYGMTICPMVFFVGLL